MRDTRLTQDGSVTRACVLGVLTLFVVVASLLEPSKAFGQATDPPPTTSAGPQHEIIYLSQGRAAPFAGALIDIDDLAWFRLEIERLRHQLASDASTAVATCDVRLSLEQAHTTAEHDRTTLHDSLYQARIDELVASLAEARHASERQWYEHPALWFAVGAVVAMVAVVVVAVEVR